MCVSVYVVSHSAVSVHAKIKARIPKKKNNAPDKKKQNPTGPTQGKQQ